MHFLSLVVGVPDRDDRPNQPESMSKKDDRPQFERKGTKLKPVYLRRRAARHCGDCGDGPSEKSKPLVNQEDVPVRCTLHMHDAVRLLQQTRADAYIRETPRQNSLQFRFFPLLSSPFFPGTFPDRQREHQSSYTVRTNKVAS